MTVNSIVAVRSCAEDHHRHANTSSSTPDHLGRTVGTQDSDHPELRSHQAATSGCQYLGLRDLSLHLSCCRRYNNTTIYIRYENTILHHISPPTKIDTLAKSHSEASFIANARISHHAYALSYSAKWCDPSALHKIGMKGYCSCLMHSMTELFVHLVRAEKRYITIQCSVLQRIRHRNTLITY